jgi:hypothetical protein
MTPAQKHIIGLLLKEHTIVHLGVSGIRLKDKAGNPITKVSPRTFRILKDILKKNKKGIWLISPREITRLHGKSWIKQQYKLLKK